MPQFDPPIYEPWSNIARGVMFINRRGKGWSEGYNLPACDLDTAEALFTPIVHARSWLLSQGCEIVCAGVRLLKRPPPWRAFRWLPLGTLKKPDTTEYWGAPNLSEDCLWLSGTTYDGRYSSRPIHAIDDDEVTNDQWIRFPLAVPPGVPVPPAVPGLATPEELFAYFFALVRDNTRHAHFLGVQPDGTTLWEVRRWRTMEVTEAGKRDLGRRWLPVSWEAGDYSFAPPWSPCGCKVMVVRSPYDAPCRFFAAGPETEIRWYVADNEAAWIERDTVFWPYAEDGDYTRAAAVGERTPIRKAWWRAGYSWGSAPGVASTGTDAEFLGLGVASYDQDLPTPLDLLPECDAMTPIINVDLFGGGVVVNNCTHLSFDPTYFGMTDMETPGENHAFVTLIPFPTPEMLAAMYAVASNAARR